jgi:hypothetical protein
MTTADQEAYEVQGKGQAGNALVAEPSAPLNRTAANNNHRSEAAPPHLVVVPPVLGPKEAMAWPNSRTMCTMQSGIQSLRMKAALVR